jgi:hypothetical protein
LIGGKVDFNISTKVEMARQATKHTRKPTPKQRKIIATKAANPDLTTRQVATLCDTDHSHVIKTLQAYGIDRDSLERYKSHKADILAGIQDRVLLSITDDDIKRASLLQRTTAVAQLYDKERLELDLSTSNISIHQDILDMREMDEDEDNSDE